MKLKRHLGIIAACLIAVTGCNSDSNSSPAAEINLSVQTEATGNIANTINSEAEFKVLSDALAITGLDALLADPDRQFTLFAPTDQAFSGMGEETLNTLFSDPGTLSYILVDHLLADQNVDSVTAGSRAGSTVTAANNLDLQVSIAASRYSNNPQAIYINDAEVFVADVPTTNGTIHAVDRVLLPAGIGGDDPGGDDPGGDDPGGDDPGGDDPDGDDPDGDDPDGNDPDGEDTGGEDTGGNDSNLVQVAAAEGDLTTLVAALQRTGLDALLSDTSKRFTIFAPTDSAFSTYDPFDILLNDD